MDALEEALAQTKVLTFDCYGTLIDWSTGLIRAFEAVFDGENRPAPESLVRDYVAIEAEVESGPYQSYRAVMAESIRRLAGRIGKRLTPEKADFLAETLPEWPPFPDTNDALVRLKNRYTLGVLSNVDRELFPKTARRFTVDFEFVITAEDVRSYKPAPGHFNRLVEMYGDRGSLLHVAQSQFHDGTAAVRLGIRFVWINRYNDRAASTARPIACLPDLKALADRVDKA